MEAFDSLLENSGKLSKVLNSTAYLFKWKSVPGGEGGAGLSLGD